MRRKYHDFVYRLKKNKALKELDMAMLYVYLVEFMDDPADFDIVLILELLEDYCGADVVDHCIDNCPVQELYSSWIFAQENYKDYEQYLV